MNPENIESALRDKFLTALPAAVDNTSFENQTFNSAGKAKWYKFTFIPNLPRVASLGSGGTDAHDGIAQIDINVPLNTGKTGVPADLEILRSAFTPGTRATYDSVSVTIKACGRTGPGRVVDGCYRFSISISWECRLAR